MTNLELVWPHPISIPHDAIPSIIREGVRHNPTPNGGELTVEKLAEKRRIEQREYQRQYWKKRALGELSPKIMALRDRRKRIIELLTKMRQRTPLQITEELQENYGTIKNDIAEMFRQGILMRVKGTWAYSLVKK